MPELRRFGGVEAPVWTLALANLARALSLGTLTVSPLQHRAVPVDRPIVAVLSIVLGVGMLMPWWRVPTWVLHLNVAFVGVTSSWFIANAPSALGVPENLIAVTGMLVYVGAWFRGRDVVVHAVLAVVSSFAAVLVRFDVRDVMYVWTSSMIAGLYAAGMVHMLMGQILRMANRDALTGVLNRAGLMALTERPGAPTYLVQPVSIVVLDLDGFKAVNDRHGHLAGDAMLTEVGRFLSAESRAGDVVARTGGDEFVMLLGGTDPENARVLIDRIRRGMPVRASFGMAQWHVGEPFDTAMAAADAAMYASKANREGPIDPS